MSDKTGNLERLPRRKLSRAARRAMGAAGKANLEAWHARQAKLLNERSEKVDAYRAELFAELGERPTATKRALAETAVLTYGCILLVREELAIRSKKEALALTERASWLTGNLIRLLKMLNLDARPRPRTLADIHVPKVGQNGSNSPTKPL